MECLICFGEGIDALLLPCQHSGLCSACAEAVLRKNPALCPICRMCVSEVIRFEHDSTAAAAGSAHVDARVTAAAGRAVTEVPESGVEGNTSAQEFALTPSAACDASQTHGGGTGNATTTCDGANGVSSASGTTPEDMVGGVEGEGEGEEAVAARGGIVDSGLADDKGGEASHAAEVRTGLTGALMGAGSVGLSEVTVDAADGAEEAEDGGAGPAASAAGTDAGATAGQEVSTAHQDAAGLTQAVAESASAGGSDKLARGAAKGGSAAGKTSRAGGGSGGAAAGGGGGKGNKRGGKGRGKGGGKGSGKG